MRSLIRGALRRKVELEPTGSFGLKQLPDAGGWRSIDPLPFFRLGSGKARLPEGWVRLSIDLEVREGDSAVVWLRARLRSGEAVAVPLRIPKTTPKVVDLKLPFGIEEIRLEPIKGAGAFTLGQVMAQETSWAELFARRMLHYCRNEGLSLTQACRAAAAHIRVYGMGALWNWITGYIKGEGGAASYGPWTRQETAALAARLTELRTGAKELRYRPKFSIVMPVHETPEPWLRKALQSILSQVYDNWELCICDDNSQASHVTTMLSSYQHLDSRIRVIRRSETGHIARATNDAMEMMTGEFMCLMDHDDVIAPHALLELAKVLNEDPGTEMLYSDEDLISIDDVRYEPILKPAWSPETLESYMYLGHLVCYRADIARRIGGFRQEVSGAQDYDFALRYTEQVRNIRHVPQILYHWRAVPGSVAVSIERKQYVIAAARASLEARLLRTHSEGQVTDRRTKGWFETKRQVVGSPMVSVILPRSIGASALDHLRSRTCYRNWEVVLSESDDSDDLNAAARAAGGDFLVFLAEGIRVRSEDWLEQMLQYAQLGGVGVVGAKVLFEDESLRHVGIVYANGLPRYVRRGYPGSDWGYWGSSDIARNYLSVSGGCLMVDRQAFADIGGVGTHENPTYRDCELCLGLAQRGYRAVYSPGAVLHHLGVEASEPDYEAKSVFREKWLGLTRPDPFYGAMLSLTPPTFEFEANP